MLCILASFALTLRAGASEFRISFFISFFLSLFFFFFYKKNSLFTSLLLFIQIVFRIPTCSTGSSSKKHWTKEAHFTFQESKAGLTKQFTHSMTIWVVFVPQIMLRFQEKYRFRSDLHRLLHSNVMHCAYLQFLCVSIRGPSVRRFFFLDENSNMSS